MRVHLIGLALFCVNGNVPSAAAQTLEVTPFVGYETSGSYPVQNPTTVEAFRAEAARMLGVFVDYPLTDNIQLEFQWVDNPTIYSAQDTLSGQYSQAFTTRIDQYQVGGLYFLRSAENPLRPYIAASVGFTHDSNSGDNPSRTAPGFGLGAGVKYAISTHVGLRGDARWMPTYGSSGLSSECDYFGNCYPMTVANYLERFNVTVGVTVRP